MSKPTPAPRRRFLPAATGTVAAGAMARADGVERPDRDAALPEHLACRDIFHEYASDFAKKVNDMAGSRLKIEVLPAGAVVPAFQLLEAVARARSTAATAWWPTTTAAELGAGAVGLGPGLRHGPEHGAGLALLRRRRGAAGRSTSRSTSTSSFLYGPMPTQPLGWFKSRSPRSRTSRA